MALRLTRCITAWLFLCLTFTATSLPAIPASVMVAGPDVLPIKPITAPVNLVTTFVVNGSFTHGPALDYDARLTNGSALPSWIKLDKTTGTFTLEPPASAAANVYNIRVTGTDENGNRSTVDFSILLDDTSLICTSRASADFLAKILGCASGNVMLRGETSTGIYRWKGPDGFTSNEQNPVVSKPGLYELSGGGECSRKSIVEVRPNLFDCATYSYNNEIPVGHFSTSVADGHAPLTVEFDAFDSYDVDGEIVNYHWTWEGGEASGPTPTVTFETEGEYNVLLTVTDDFGAKSTDRYTMIVKAPTGHGIDTYWLEPECGEVGSKWSLVADDNAAGGYYVVPVETSAGGPPADEARNRIRFTLDSPTNQWVKLFARVSSAGLNSDSYWVRINGGYWIEWSSGIKSTGNFAWNEYSDKLELKAGENIIDFALRESEAKLDKIFLTSTTQVPSGEGLAGYNCDNDTAVAPSDNEVWLEAECAEVGSRWKTYNGSSAANGSFVNTTYTSMNNPPEDVPATRVRFTLDNSGSKLVTLFARVSAADRNSDSYWVRVNGGSWYKWSSGIDFSGKYVWNEFPNQLTLKDGINTIDFALREANTKLDKIFLSAVGTSPTGTGGAADNCDNGSTDESMPDPDPEPEPEQPTSPPADPTSLWLEAECATVGSRWATESSSNAVNGKYVVSNDRESMSSPPYENPDNHVRFTFDGAEAGNYHLFARVSADGFSSDSYWVRVNGGSWIKWYNGIATGVGFKWNLMPNSKLNLTSGTNTIDFAFREKGAKLDRIHLNLDGKLPTGDGGAAYNCGGSTGGGGGTTVFALEAECGRVGSNWKSVSDGNASSGKYVTNTSTNMTSSPPASEASQLLTYEVSVTTPGIYHLYLRLNAPDVASNSIWVSVDNGNWIKMWKEIGGDALLTNGFEWRKVNHDGKDKSFNLATGKHTIVIANRETNTALDKLVLSLDKTKPTNLGPAAGNCGSSTDMTMFSKMPSSSPAAADEANTLLVGAEPVIEVYPNPTVDRFTLDLTSDFYGEVHLRLMDMNGRQIRDLQYNKDADLLHSQVDVTDLPRGMYRVQVIEGDRETVRPFVKM